MDLFESYYIKMFVMFFLMDVNVRAWCAGHRDSSARTIAD